MKIGIYVLATNAYFILGLRFIRRFVHFYKGDATITFYFFSDTDPAPYLPDGVRVKYFHVKHNDWVQGVNSKFPNIVNNQNQIDEDYLYYFDADTNIVNDFTEEWFIGDMVAGQHFGDQTWMKDVKGYDRYAQSSCYVPLDTPHFQIYLYGAFFGGKTQNVVDFCRIIHERQKQNKAIGHEPGVNDESYLNHHFHYNPPTRIVPTPEFKFVISDKGSLGETRNPKLNIETQKEVILANRDKLFDIINAQVKVTGNPQT